MADKPANAEMIIGRAREAGVRLAVGHIERFNPAVRKLKEVIDEGYTHVPEADLQAISEYFESLAPVRNAVR